MTSLPLRDQTITRQGSEAAPTGARPRHSWRRVGLMLLMLLAGMLASAQALAVDTTCSPATGQGASGPADYATYCWFDLSGYVNATANGAGQNFVVTLPGGAKVSFNLKTTGSLIPTLVPSWSGAAFGQSAFTGIPGKPVLYIASDGTSPTFQLTGISVAANGSSNLPFAIVAADGESTNTGEKLTFTTIGGSNWATLATIRNGTSNTYPTLAGAGTATVTETGADGTVGAYAFTSNFPSSGTSSVTGSMTGSGLQGALFGVKFYAADLAITKSHTSNFIAGGNGSYNIAVRNNGPDTATGVTTVTDTLPTGLTYASASGSGWTCSATGQVVVTCTNPNQIANGANLPAITLNVNVAADAPNTINNTATVSNPTFDYNTSNSSSTDPTTIIHSDLSTSTKTVLDTNGGDTNPGDTLRYTITLTNSTAGVATNVSVSDDMPAGVGGLSVISAAGGTDGSTANGGANGTGKVSISGISVPANGSVTIVYEVTVSGSAASGSTIDNTAKITNPNGIGATTPMVSVTVSQSRVAAKGNKVLYIHADQSMDRRTGKAGVSSAIGENSNKIWTLSSVQKSLTLTSGAQISVSLVISRDSTASNAQRTVYVQLLKNGTTQIGNNSNTATFTPTTTATLVATPLNITVPNDGSGNLSPGDTLVLRIVNTSSGSGTRSINVNELGATTGRSSLSFDTTTVVNVDSTTIYSVPYTALPNSTTKSSYSPGDTLYVRSVISDPFGSYDVNHATVTLTDPNGNAQVVGAAMTQKADSGAATRTYEYNYTLPANAASGYWTASVTGYEGTENMVQHTANAAFNVGVPNLLVMKSATVISDPVEGTTKPKSLPGAVMQYQITVSNNGSGPADNNSLVITDPLPTNTKFVIGSVSFAEGTPGSGLSLVPANVTYSSTGSSGPWTYAPVNDGSGADASVKALKIAPQGIMAGKTGSSAPNFSVTFRVIIL